MMACYIFPIIGRDDYKRKIDKIMEFVRERWEPMIVFGDLNTK